MTVAVVYVLCIQMKNHSHGQFDDCNFKMNSMSTFAL